MDAERIRSLEPRLRSYLKQFDDCFGRSEPRGHLGVVVRGQLSDLPRKNAEPMADAAGVPARTLQQFFSLLKWDHGRMRDTLQKRVAAAYADADSIGLIDETSCAKKGDKSPGVQRQWCGSSGKKDNCVVTVHLGYAAGDFHCLVDTELFLPESWSADRTRCREASVPDSVVHRPKTDIALELHARAAANGLAFGWLTFDEGYGKSVRFLEELRKRKQKFVAEVPVTFRGWIHAPAVTSERRGQTGRKPAKPRPASGSAPFRSVREHLAESPELRDQPWEVWHVRDGAKGPMVWEAKRVRFYPNGEDGVPLEPVHLVAARNPREPETVKFFVAHAPAETPLGVLLFVAFSRWRVERCFEDEKTELGFDHFEGRSYVGLMRHQTVAMVTHLFLAEVCRDGRGEKPGADRLPGADGRRRPGAVVVAGKDGRRKAFGTGRSRHPENAGPQRQVA